MVGRGIVVLTSSSNWLDPIMRDIIKDYRAKGSQPTRIRRIE